VRGFLTLGERKEYLCSNYSQLSKKKQVNAIIYLSHSHNLFHDAIAKDSATAYPHLLAEFLDAGLAKW